MEVKRGVEVRRGWSMENADGVSRGRRERRGGGVVNAKELGRPERK